VLQKEIARTLAKQIRPLRRQWLARKLLVQTESSRTPHELVIDGKPTPDRCRWKNALHEVVGQMRVLRDALEARMNAKMEAKDPVRTWLAGYAAVLLNS
jgi:hypothetical protein